MRKSKGREKQEGKRTRVESSMGQKRDSPSPAFPRETPGTKGREGGERKEQKKPPSYNRHNNYSEVNNRKKRGRYSRKIDEPLPFPNKTTEKQRSSNKEDKGKRRGRYSRKIDEPLPLPKKTTEKQRGSNEERKGKVKAFPGPCDDKCS